MPIAEATQKDFKRKLTRVVRILEEKYGPHIYPEDQPAILEQIVFAILATRNPVTNARKALRDLKEEFVDWNEVRAGTVRMIEDVLDRARIEEPGRHAEILKTLLQKVFDEVCRVTLDTLKTEGPEKARKTVSKLDILEPHEQQYLLVGAGVEEAPPLDPATDRIGARLGLFQPEDPPARRRKLLESLVASPDALRFHHLMVEHGKKLCTEDDPKCAKCPAQVECDFFKTLEARRRSEPKAKPVASAAAAAAPAAKKAAAPKKAAKAPAAAKAADAPKRPKGAPAAAPAKAKIAAAGKGKTRPAGKRARADEDEE